MLLKAIEDPGLDDEEGGEEGADADEQETAPSTQ